MDVKAKKITVVIAFISVLLLIGLLYLTKSENQTDKKNVRNLSEYPIQNIPEVPDYLHRELQDPARPWETNGSTPNPVNPDYRTPQPGYNRPNPGYNRTPGHNPGPSSPYGN